MIYFPRAVDDPRQLPELRAALMELAETESWAASEILTALQQILGGHSSTIDHPDEMVRDVVFEAPPGTSERDANAAMAEANERGQRNVYWYRKKLPEAQLIYVTPELTDLVVEASKAVPSDHKLHLEHLPAPVGLVVFGRPIVGVDAVTGLDLRTDALMWGPVRLPGINDPLEGGSFYNMSRFDDGVTVSWFRMMAPEHTDDNALARPTERPIWLPLGRSDWLLEEKLDHTEQFGLDVDTWRSMVEDRQIVASLWAILQQRRLTESVEVHAPKAARRRLERENRPLDPVTVVHLRRPEKRRETSPTGRHVNVRFMVRPFWRQQPYGPGRSKRKLILVAAHIRGPADAPLVHSERVWSLDQ